LFINISEFQCITTLEVLSLENVTINPIKKISLPNLQTLTLEDIFIDATTLSLLLDGVPNLTFLRLKFTSYSGGILNVTTSFSALEDLTIHLPRPGLVKLFSAFSASAATLDRLSLDLTDEFDANSLQVFNKLSALHVSGSYHLPEVLFFEIILVGNHS
jgi:hypothetical protein